jgi:hypothetical protein
VLIRYALWSREVINAKPRSGVKHISVKGDADNFLCCNNVSSSADQIDTWPSAWIAKTSWSGLIKTALWNAPNSGSVCRFGCKTRNASLSSTVGHFAPYCVTLSSKEKSQMTKRDGAYLDWFWTKTNIWLPIAHEQWRTGDLWIYWINNLPVSTSKTDARLSDEAVNK